MFRHCDWCGERRHANEEWVELVSGLVVCYSCSIRDISAEWFELSDAEADPADEEQGGPGQEYVDQG